MRTDTSETASVRTSSPERVLGRMSRLEWVVAAIAAVVLVRRGRRTAGEAREVDVHEHEPTIQGKGEEHR